MIQIQQLVYFREVARQHSMNKAAQQLYITQSSLSKSMKTLEKELGTELFARTNKGVQLTPEGIKLYQYAKTVLRQMDLIAGIGGQKPRRYLSVAAYPAISMAGLVRQYYEENRNADIEIILEEQRLLKVLEYVANMSSEIGIIQYNQAQKHHIQGYLKAKNLEFKFLARDTWFVNVGPVSPLYGREQVELRELLDFPLVRARDDMFSQLTTYLEVDGVPFSDFTNTIFVNNGSAILSLLRETDAFRFGPGFCREDYEKYGIRTIPIKNCPIEIEIGWVKRRREELSEESRQFVALLEQFFVS